MKKIFGLLLCAAAVLTVSCERQEQPFGFGNKGKAVKFTTSVGTKTALQGYAQGGVEAVLWEDGDVFTVWSEQASVADSDQKWADYKVTASAGVATAVNPATEGVELLWGEDAHTFFAGYPAGKLQGDKLSANIPSTQKLNKLDDFVFGPALSEIGYMAASAQAQPDAATVNLAFKPLFNVFEFIVSAGETAEVNVTDFRLGVQEGSKVVLAGGFAANLSAQAAPEIVVDYSGASGEIKAQLGDGSGVKLLQGQTLTVSVIALPLDLSALIAYFTVDGKEVAVPLVKKDGSPILFPAGQKARVTALGVLAPQTPPTPPTPADPVVITVEINGIPVTDYDLSKEPDPGPELDYSGPFGELYLTRGYLKETEDGYSLSGNDQLEVLKYYQYCDAFSNVPLPRYYHRFRWSEPPGGTGPDVIEGYVLPSLEQYQTILGIGADARQGATVNGVSGKHYAAVAVDLTGSEYESYGLSGNNTINGLLLFPDGATFNCAELTSFNNPQTLNAIAYEKYLALCAGTKGCLFLPCAGKMYQDVSWSEPIGFYLTSSRSNENYSSMRYVLEFHLGGSDAQITEFDTGGSPQFCPVRLIKK